LASTLNNHGNLEMELCNYDEAWLFYNQS
jgi:hypothetical protein